MKWPRPIVNAAKFIFVASLACGFFLVLFAILAGFVFAVSCAWHAGAA